MSTWAGKRESGTSVSTEDPRVSWMYCSHLHLLHFSDIHKNLGQGRLPIYWCSEIPLLQFHKSHIISHRCAAPHITHVFTVLRVVHDNSNHSTRWSDVRTTPYTHITIHSSYDPEKSSPRFYAKSPTARDVFWPIPGLTCAGVTRRWGLPSYAQNAVRWLVLSIW